MVPKKKNLFCHIFLSVMIVVVWFLLFLVLLCKVQRGHTWDRPCLFDE